MNTRTEELIRLYKIITKTKLSKNNVLKLLNSTRVIQELQKGNEVYLYDSIAANMLDIINELKTLPDCPQALLNITEQQITEAEEERIHSIDTIEYKMLLNLVVFGLESVSGCKVSPHMKNVINSTNVMMKYQNGKKFSYTKSVESLIDKIVGELSNSDDAEIYLVCQRYAAKKETSAGNEIHVIQPIHATVQLQYIPTIDRDMSKNWYLTDTASQVEIPNKAYRPAEEMIPITSGVKVPINLK